ncbi:PREDICTED: LOW QUALITY PROTEIN: dimodular nonribosomal peptide synthase-like [Priapulus caudatus]|uniref:LOW QUALITY PROTEIN: dimodular nonribosomal peptide synthase-like n=1 Tax=Priapulus caudatus TaxID=37621 RepID=A0ABM1F6B1_PRICU|nr:PREDICTED: LOW QUALITY PROTEIN: dimodular nonribosomal peptide synthase-like [Priapulus caudatus]
MFAALISSADKQRDDAFLDGTALFCDGARVTFRELDRRSNRLARRLAGKIGECADVAATASRDKVVVVDMAPSERLVVALFAVMKIDVAYLPVDPGFPAARIAYVVNDARPLCILADRRDATLVDAERQFAAHSRVRTTSWRPTTTAFPRATLKPDERLPHDYRTPLLACVLYTSGSEGRPKGVRLPHKVIMNRLCWHFVTKFSLSLGDGRPDRLFKTSTTFVDHLQEVFGALLRGVPVVVVAAATTRDPRALVDVLESRGVTRFVLVPSLLRMLLAFLPPAGTGKPRLPRLRLWVCSGETLSAELLREFFVRFPSGRTICNFYGSTEVTGDVTYATFESAPGVGGGVPIGRPIYNTIVYLLDDAMTAVARGERGEMYVAGLSVAAGYVGAAEENARRFLRNSFCDVPGYCALFRTGDFARVDDDGSLVFEGRTDAQVKVRGHRVDLAEIENAARQFPGTA